MGEVHRLPRRPLMLEVDTKELLERGYTYIPFNRVRAFAASELFRRFLSRKSEADKLLWSFGVEDPADPDDGLCRKRGQNGEDYKYFFHWSSILSHLLIGRGVIATDEDWEFLGETGELFSLCRKIAYRVASSIDRSGGISFNFRFEMRKAEINPLPFSRSKLR